MDKQCSRCGQIKPVSEFGRRKIASDGLRSNCKECDKAYRDAYRSNPENQKKERASSRAWKRRNRESVSEYNKEWSSQNGELKQKLRRRWHLAHRDEENKKAKERTKQWIQDNPDRHRHNGHQYRARKAQAEGSHTLEQWQELLSFFDGICPACGKKRKLTLDHIVPLNKNGSDYIDNIQPLCKRCNSAKMDLVIVDYRPDHIKQWATAQRTNET